MRADFPAQLQQHKNIKWMSSDDQALALNHTRNIIIVGVNEQNPLEFVKLLE